MNNPQQIQPAVEVQNPTTTLQDNKKRNNTLLFLAVSMVGAFFIAFFIKNLLSGSLKSDPKPPETASPAVSASHVDPFANLDSLRYQPDTPAPSTPNAGIKPDAPKPEPLPVDILKASSAVVATNTTNRAGSSSNAGAASTRMRYPEDTGASSMQQQAQMQALFASDSGNSPRQNSYEGLNYGTAKASVSPLNPSLSIAKGTFIRCSLRTRIVTTVGGEVACTVTNDVYSTNGRVLLIEKGSQVLGHFKSGGSMNLGDARVFVIWNEIRTPHNIRIEINSNATGALGETGIGGWVDNHFWDRFGAAILVSVITDTSGALTSHIADNNGNNSYDYTKDTRDSAREIVSSILDKTVGIPPTLYRNQGDIVGIMVSRDLDFSEVYALQLKID